MAGEEQGKSRGEQIEEGASLVRTLIDWEGTDLKRIYEPLSDQVAYIFTTILVLVFAYFLWTKLKEWRAKNQPTHLPYRVIKPPSSVIADKEPKKKRIVAVVGGTGFVGSHIVNELIQRKQYYVYSLGRTFRPSRTNPDADCLIQVDLLDPDGLVSAFQGVDSVINAAAVVPNVFMTAHEVWLKNKNAHKNVLMAAKKAGVKNLVFLSGMRPKSKIKNAELKAFSNILTLSEEMVVSANGQDGLRTCAISPGNIVGINSPFFDSLLSGKMSSSPMTDVGPVSFSPAEYVARAIVNAEVQLSVNDNTVAGKAFPLRGEILTWRQFYSLWPMKISETPMWLLTPLIRINTICASVFNKAPFGADLAPYLADILSFVEADYEESEIQRAYSDLDVGPPSPPMEEYIKELVQKYKERQSNNKKDN